MSFEVNFSFYSVREKKIHFDLVTNKYLRVILFLLTFLQGFISNSIPIAELYSSVGKNTLNNFTENISSSIALFEALTLCYNNDRSLLADYSSIWFVFFLLNLRITFYRILRNIKSGSKWIVLLLTTNIPHWK